MIQPNDPKGTVIAQRLHLLNAGVVDGEAAAASGREAYGIWFHGWQNGNELLLFNGSCWGEFVAASKGLAWSVFV